MPKLHQILALEKSRKNRAKQDGDRLYHNLQKERLANGHYGTYTPNTPEDAPLPAEMERVQVNAAKLLEAYTQSQTAAWDISATKDAANTQARASVVVDGETILADVAVTTLISLEKQLTDLRTVISAAPTLDPAEEWHPDSQTGLWRTAAVETERTKKVTEPVVVIPPTDKHPGQWTDRSRDIKAGVWTRFRVSGALEEERKALLLTRVNQLLEAVKTAREEANTLEAPDVQVAGPIFSWLLAG